MKYRVRGFTFSTVDGGGMEIHAKGGASVILTEDELFELMAVVGLTADAVSTSEVDPYEFDDRDLIPD